MCMSMFEYALLDRIFVFSETVTLYHRQWTCIHFPWRWRERTASKTRWAFWFVLFCCRTSLFFVQGIQGHKTIFLFWSIFGDGQDGQQIKWTGGALHVWALYVSVCRPGKINITAKKHMYIGSWFLMWASGSGGSMSCLFYWDKEENRRCAPYLVLYMLETAYLRTYVYTHSPKATQPHGMYAYLCAHTDTYIQTYTQTYTVTKTHRCIAHKPS